MYMYVHLCLHILHVHVHVHVLYMQCTCYLQEHVDACSYSSLPHLYMYIYRINFTYIRDIPDLMVSALFCRAHSHSPD